MKIFRAIFLFFLVAIQGLYADEQSESIIAGKNEFCFQLFNALGAPKGNVCLSPYNISSALELTYLGAQGATKKEIGELLHLPLMSDEALCAKVLQQENFLSRSVSNAKALALDTCYTPTDQYLQMVRKNLGADLFDVSFRKKPKEALQIINSWVSQKTHGHIPELLQTNDVTANTRLILLGAIYLKAEWLLPFNEKLTKESTFKKLDNTEMQVPMMHQTETLRYAQDKDVQIVWRNFKTENEQGPALQAIIILPRDSERLLASVKNLSETKLQEWENASANQYVDLFIPKCSLRQRLSLKKPLEQLGMKQAFTQLANFSVIESRSDLQIDDVLHEAYMQIDEAGVEAAAATAVKMVMKSSLPNIKKPVVVRCDRPFLVVIKEKNSGLILFVSVIASPQKILKTN